MALPGFQDFMLPILKTLKDGKEHQKKELKQVIGQLLKLSEEDKSVKSQNGKYFVFSNRLAWALTYLKHAGLIDSKKLGFYEITKEGLKVLGSNPPRIDRKFLLQYKTFREFLHPGAESGLETENGVDNEEEKIELPSNEDPQEMMETGYQIILNGLYKEILDKVKSCTPRFFEILVVELLLTMGYGGSLKDAGKAIGQSGDGGIDGIIKEDKLGLDVIYIQAKRWEGSVGRPEIQKFVGSLVGNHANKGVFITTSFFSKDAENFVKTIQHKVVLINGETLAQYMVDYDLGVTKEISYDIKRIDNDFFVEE